MGLLKTRPLIEIKNMVNWKRLTDKISDLKLMYQHYTTSTKLYIAKRHYEKLSEIAPTKKITDLMRVNVKEQKAEFPPSFLRKSGDYLGEHDAFFFSLRSCFDSFLWEIDLVFNLESELVKEIKPKMNKKYKDKEITKLLNSLQGECWFKYLRYIRNNLAHHKLSEIVTFTEDLKLYLPSNPKTDSYSREKEFEVLPCLENLYLKTKGFLEKGYGFLIDEVD